MPYHEQFEQTAGGSLLQNNPEWQEQVRQATEQQKVNKEDYGVKSIYGEEDLFTKITEGMKTATERGTYQPFFEIQQQSQEGGFLKGLNQLGMTAGGQASGFASSGADTSMLTQMQDEYARGIMETEQGVQEKMASAERNIQSITQANQSTSLTLKQLENDSGDDGGTSFICGQIKKYGKMTFRESLGMMKFLLKTFFTHPSATEWYTRNGMKIIKEANELGLDWSNPRFKKMFVTDIIKLEKLGHHNRAVWMYINNCLILSQELWLELDYKDSLWTNSLYNRIKGWVRMLLRKPTWKYGSQYLVTIMRFSNGRV